MAKKTRLLTSEVDMNDIDILSDDEDMAIVSLDLMHTGVNRNKCDIPEEAIEVSLRSVANKPITFRYNKQNMDATDVVEHAHNDKELFETRVAGHVPTGSRMRLVERENGKVYLNVEGVLQKRYIPTLMHIIHENKDKLKVSVEFRAEGTQDDDGIFHISRFKLQAITLLSDLVLEGIEGSCMTVVEPTTEEVDEMNERYFAFSSNRGNIIGEIQNVKEVRAKLNTLTTRQLEQRIWDKLKDFTYHDGTWTGKRYWVEDTDTDGKFVYIHDNMTDTDYKVPYKLSKDGEVTLDMDGKVEVKHESEWKERAVKNAFTFAVKEYGKGEKIEIDKTPEAMSDTAWGNVDKIDLRNKVLDAENYKELVRDVYLVVEDGWEDAPSEHLKYPVMQIKAGKAVYNRYGLASALSYAEGEKDEDVVKKVHEIYKDLGIETAEKKNDLDDGEDEKDEHIDEHDSEDDKLKEAFDHLKEEHDELLARHEELKAEHEKLLSERDEMKRKYGEVENRCAEVEKELGKYHAAEMLEEKNRYGETYRKAFADDEYEIIAAKVKDETCCYDEFKKFVDDRIMEKAKAQFACKEPTEKTFKNAAVMYSFDGNKKANKPKTIDDVLTSLG